MVPVFAATAGTESNETMAITMRFKDKRKILFRGQILPKMIESTPNSNSNSNSYRNTKQSKAKSSTGRTTHYTSGKQFSVQVQYNTIQYNTYTNTY